MKKVLFATTALVASAGIASAQGVSLSGSAEMGVVGGDLMPSGVTQFWNDIDVTFTLSGETDNGLTFGATIDLDELNGTDIIGTSGGSGVAGGLGSGADNDSSVFLSGNFGTLTMGDTDGALDWALRDLDIIGDINDSNTSHAGFNGNSLADGPYDGQIARYEYAFGDFAFAVSAELDDFDPAFDPILGIGVRYNANLGGVDLGLGLGYQGDGSTDLIGVSVDAGFSNGFRAIINYTDLDGGGFILDDSGYGGNTFLPYSSHAGIGLFYTMDALSVGVNYGVYAADIAGAADRTGFGLAVNYDLGGGAVVQFGYGSSSVQDTLVLGDTVSADSFSLGVAMSF